ncbi:hypothetical protein COCNU_scaffold041207G000030 [Cocos nucifera]|nr:hypothetical protein [Cocos nucifera]
MFVPRRGIFFIFDLPSSIYNWKTQFFLVSSTLPWSFSFIWGTPNISPDDNNRIDPADWEDFLKLKDMELPKQKDLLTDQALYDAEVGPVPTTAAMCSLSSLSAVDIHRLVGKCKSVADEGSSRVGKKQRVGIPAIAAILPTYIPSGMTSSIDIPSIEISRSIGEVVVALVAPALTQDALAPASVEDMLTRAPPAIEKLDDGVVVVQPPAALIEPTTSQAPSMPKVGLEEQRLVVSSMPPTLELLAKQLVDAILLPSEKKSQKGWILNNIFSSFYISLIGGWKDKTMAIAAERNAALQHLQVASDKMKMMEEQEKSFKEKNSQLKTKLESA